MWQFGVLLSIIALPHVLYAIIWWWPSSWLRLFSKSQPPSATGCLQAVAVFSKVAVALKALQFLAFGYWYYISGPLPNWSSLTINTYVISLVMIGIGQTLNFAVYKALGKTGVYYGYKFGIHVPWCNGFPFNIIFHPQYVGCIFSVIGLLFLLQREDDQQNFWVNCCAWFWSACYVVSACIEEWT